MSDDILATLLLEDNKTIEPSDLEEGIRRMCISCNALPVLCGSALRGVAIQPLMNSIIKYLPTASELTLKIPTVADELCAYSFKQVYDNHRGVLVYLRILSGTLKPNTTIYNASRHSREKVTRILSAQADQLQEVKATHNGSIAVAVGLKNTLTGDILVQSEKVGRSEGVASLLTPPTIPPPVFFCTVEPSSAANQKSLEHALQCLTREDPSLCVAFDPDSGQTVLSGMGELHLEIVEERLKRVYGVECEMGQLQVAYREGLSHEINATVTLKHPNIVAMVTLLPNECDDNNIEVIFDSCIEFTSNEEREGLIAAVKGCLIRGPLLGYPVHNVSVYVNKLIRNEEVSIVTICNCVTQAVVKAIKEGNMKILEPVTDLKITVCEEYVGVVLSDLSSVRRAQIKTVRETEDKETMIIATVPLATLLGYASKLRSLTSGTATFTMLFSGYSPVDCHQQKRMIEELRGY